MGDLMQRRVNIIKEQRDSVVEVAMDYQEERDELKEKLAAAEEESVILKSEIERLQQLMNYGKLKGAEEAATRLHEENVELKGKLVRLVGITYGLKDKVTMLAAFVAEGYEKFLDSAECAGVRWDESETKAKLDEILEVK